MTTTINNKLTVDQIKERLFDARDLRNGLTSHMVHEVMPRVRGTRDKIGRDANLTSKGQLEKIAKFNKQQEVKLFSEISQIKETYTLLLQDAKASAEQILIGDVEQPDETSQKLFDLQKNKLQSAVMFAPTTNEKIKALTEFAKLGEKGQAFAQQIQSDFLAMSQQAMSSTTKPEDLSQLTHALGNLNTSLESNAFSEDQKQASNLLQTVEGHLALEFVNTAVLGNALTEISKDAHNYANNIEGYATDHAERVTEYEQAERLGQIIK
ncbi:hypothetical protein [Bacillus cereus]|uniref:hypothetical protein n=1 Tax=Bacillus cereus group TaxID=86661 RepID=UPI0001A00D2F|nr:hypothetical protein [Bacillus cereus]EEK76879.1 hypothetical protein bcere0009_42010 [Bacillus cereus R309803]HDR4560935.1 hypothetical protein [Bacillus luti]HDR4564096.1 hypothetical protein [Bacillus luti]